MLNIEIPEDDVKSAIEHVTQIEGLCAQVISVYLAFTGRYCVAKPIFKAYSLLIAITSVYEPL